MDRSKTVCFSIQFGDLNMLLMCIFPCDFGVVSADIWHCSGVVWLLFVYKNDRKSCDFAVKTLCFIWFQYDCWRGKWACMLSV